MPRARSSTPAHKKLLRKARNRRHYEKKIRLEAVRARLSASHTATRREHIPGPLVLSKNLSILNADELRDLNVRLQAWGYVDDHAAFVADSEASLLQVLKKKDQLRKWIRVQEDWLEEGHSMITGMRKVMSGTIPFELTPHEVGELYYSIMNTSYKVQYMMVGVEFALDKFGDA